MNEIFEVDDNIRCVDCGSLAMGERLLGMNGEDEVVELVCYEHMTWWAR